MILTCLVASTLTASILTYLYLVTHPWYWHLPQRRLLLLGILWPHTLIRILRDEDLELDRTLS